MCICVHLCVCVCVYVCVCVCVCTYAHASSYELGVIVNAYHTDVQMFMEVNTFVHMYGVL